MSESASTQGYSALSIAGHWITAILVVALFLTHEGERGSLSQAFHVSGGAVAGFFLLWRVWHRASRGMPDRSDQAALLNLLARVVLIGLLASIVVVVVTGYLLPWTAGQPLDIGGLFEIPSFMERNRGIHDFVEEAHELSGQAFVPLVVLHLLGAAKHAFLDRDGLVRRMVKPVAGGR